MFGRNRTNKEEQGASSPTPSAMEEGRAKPKQRRSSKNNKKKQVLDLPARRNSHKCFLLVSLLTALSAVWMAIGQVLGIVVYENTVVTYTLRGYVILLCVLVVLVELEWPQPVREMFLFRHWVSRGLFYTFIGVVGMQENESSDVVITKTDSDVYEMMSDIVIVVAWNMVGCGLLYIVMGLLCLHYVLKRLRVDYEERVQRAQERNEGKDDDGMEENEENNNTSGYDSTQQEALEAAQSAFAEEQGPNNVKWSKTEVKNSKNEGEGEKEAEKAAADRDEQPAWTMVKESDDDESVNGEKSSTEAIEIDAEETQQTPSWAEETDHSVVSSNSVKASTSYEETKNSDTADEVRNDDVSVENSVEVEHQQSTKGSQDTTDHSKNEEETVSQKEAAKESPS